MPPCWDLRVDGGLELNLDPHRASFSCNSAHHLLYTLSYAKLERLVGIEAA